MTNKQETINQIREFNRFYTVLIGFLNRNYLDSNYSVTETRILFELRQNEQLNANKLIDLLHLDKSYISRIIRNFEKAELITRTPSLDDKRALIIQLTNKGLEETEKLINITNLEIFKLVEPFNSETCNDLCNAMKKIINIFTNDNDLQEEYHGN